MFLLSGVRYKSILEIDKLAIDKHKITCIVGESGSGKTTLLRLLNKMISCDVGEILYNGQKIDSIDSVKLRREVAMLPQQPTIFPGTIRENLLIGIKFAEKHHLEDEQLLPILSMINLKKSLEDDASDLSGGEKQRLALGRILLLDPEVFLLDEPSSALDEETEQILFSRMIPYVKNERKTMIIVTHSKRLAGGYADKIVEIREGSITGSKEVER